LLNRLLVNRQFARVWLAGAVSTVGDFVFDTTVLLWISTVLARGQPWAPTAASGVLIAVLVPTVVVGPLAGVFVDRWDARRTMLWSDAVRAALVGGLVGLPLLPSGALPVPAELVLVYAVIVLNTVVSRFFVPARFTIIADIVPEHDQARASGITQATSAAAGIIGPPLAAPLLFTAGVEWALALNALSFVFSYLVIWRVRAPATEARRSPAGDAGGFWWELRVGLATIGRIPIVRSMVIIAVIANIAAQVFNALGVFFVMVDLHTPARFFGLQDTMLGSGVVVRPRHPVDGNRGRGGGRLAVEHRPPRTGRRNPRRALRHLRHDLPRRCGDRRDLGHVRRGRPPRDRRARPRHMKKGWARARTASTRRWGKSAQALKRLANTSFAIAMSDSAQKR
jgi:MFS family permease